MTYVKPDISCTMTIYENLNMGGRKVVIGPPDSDHLNFNDTASSAKVASGCTGKLWEADNKTGRYLVLGTGDSTSLHFNDVASSVKVPSGCSVTLYTADNFGGTAKTFTSDVASLGSYGIDNQVSSAKVSSGCSVTLYENTSYGGRKLIVGGDSSFVHMGDIASSAEVPSNCTVVLYEEVDKGGKHIIIGGGSSTYLGSWDYSTYSVSIPAGCAAKMTNRSYTGYYTVFGEGDSTGIYGTPKASSLKLSAVECAVTLYTEAEFGGSSQTFTSDVPDLRSYGFNDVTRSAEVFARDGCTIGGTFYENGAYNPNNKCQKCDTSKSKTSWSNVADGTDPANWCSATWNSCGSTCVRKGGDGNCYSGACDTTHRTGNIASGYVCTGSGAQTAVSSSNYCNYWENCNKGDCSATKYYRACAGTGSCRTNNTGAATETVIADNGKVLTSACNQHSPSPTYYCNIYNSCTNGACVGHQYYRACNGSGSCRRDNTYAYDKTVYVSAGYSLTSTCGTTGSTLCGSSYLAQIGRAHV